MNVPVTVVIPTHNRAARLRATLDTLARQTYPAQNLCVVVVMDGCTDDTRAMLTGYPALFELHMVELPGVGPASARNQGAAQAATGIILFLDDDMSADPDLVASHVASHYMHADFVGLGIIAPSITGRGTFFDIALRQWWASIFDQMQQPGYRYGYRDVMTGHVSLEASLFHRVGGFNSSLRVHEDYEFGLRLLNLNARLGLVSTAIACHHDETTLDRLLQRKVGEGAADVTLAGLHPEITSTLPLAALMRPNAVRWFSVASRVQAPFDAMMHTLRRTLDIFEILRQRRRWHRLFNRLQTYWYWRGALTQAGGATALRQVVTAGKSSDPILQDYDLREGVAAVETRLDAERPQAARLRYGNRIVGEMPGAPGRELLRGEHLRPYLATTLGPSLWWALILDGQLAPMTTRANTDQSRPLFATDDRQRPV